MSAVMGTPPCDGCADAARCKATMMACRAYEGFINGSADWRTLSRKATRTRYRRVFDSAALRQQHKRQREERRAQQFGKTPLFEKRKAQAERMLLETVDVSGTSLRERLDGYERIVILTSMRENGGNLAKTARALQITRPTLYDKIGRLEILIDR